MGKPFVNHIPLPEGHIIWKYLHCDLRFLFALQRNICFPIHAWFPPALYRGKYSLVPLWCSHHRHRITLTATRMWWSTAFVSNIYYLFDIKKMFNFWENCILCRGLRMVLVLLLLFPRPNPYDGSMSFLFLLAMCSFVILVFSERRRGTSLSRSRSHSVAHEWHRFQLCDGNGWACTLAPYRYQWYDLTF